MQMPTRSMLSMVLCLGLSFVAITALHASSAKAQVNSQQDSSSGQPSSRSSSDPLQTSPRPGVTEDPEELLEASGDSWQSISNCCSNELRQCHEHVLDVYERCRTAVIRLSDRIYRACNLIADEEANRQCLIKAKAEDLRLHQLCYEDYQDNYFFCFKEYVYCLWQGCGPIPTDR